MEKKSSPGKYMLVFEPCYSTTQYAVYFTPDGDANVTRIKKYTDTPCDDKQKKVKKNTLGDIDKVMAPICDLGFFFKEYVDPKVFSYSRDNIHKMFIGYKRKEKIYALDYIIDNHELAARLHLLEGSKIYDPDMRAVFLDLITNSKNNSFLKFTNKSYQNNETHLSKDTLDLANNLRMATDHTDSAFGCFELTGLLDERLTSYKEYREMFILRQRYLVYLNEEKKKLEAAKKIVATPKPKRTNEIQGGEQLTFFDALGEPKIKKLGSRED